MVNDQSNKSDDPQDSPEMTDWSQAEAIITKPSESVVAVGPDQAVQPIEVAVMEPEGIVASFQAKKLKRKLALQLMHNHYTAQLEVAKDTFEHAVRAKKADTEIVTRQFLDRLNEGYIIHMTELGLRNVKIRNEALVKLNDQTSATMREIQEKDWPKPLRKQAMDGAMQIHQRFFKKVLEEIGEENKD